MVNHCLKESTRDAILDAANRLLERYGYKKTTMDDLAQEAGIGKGTIYLYFRSKEEVALSVVDRNNARLNERLRAIGRTSAPPAERIRRMLVERVLFRFDTVQSHTQSLDQMYAALRSHFLERRERYYAAEAEVFAEVLIEGRLAGAFAFEDAIATAYTLLWATTALLPYSLSPRELGRRDELRERANRMADLLVRGLTCPCPCTAGNDGADKKFDGGA